MKISIDLPAIAAAVTLAFALPDSAAAQTYYDMMTGDYSQSFTGWTSYAINWNGLPVNATGSIPSATRITAASTNIIAPSSSGGVQSTNTSTNLQFLSTGSTANTSSTAADLNLNFSGRNAGTISFAAAQVANSTGNRVGTLQLYYSTNGTAWTEITGAGLPFTATNNAALSANISASLPAALNGQSTVKLRFYYYNGPSNGTTGSRPKISIDDLLVTSTAAVAGAPVITSGSTASAVAYEANANIYQITASNSPDSYAATGLPEGLSINTTTGVISGTPTVPGTYSVGVSASNNQGTGGASLTLTVTKNPGAPSISSSLTSTDLVGNTYSYQIVANNTPTSYAAGSLPAGLTVNTATGLISGTPTVGGVFNVAISASNALGTDTQTLVITINSAPVITSPTSGSLYVTNNFGYTISASFTPTSYGASNLPAGWTVTSSNGVITNGSTPLTAGTVSFGISATNSFGTGSATYTLKVFDQAMQDAVPLNVVVNKYLNGTPDKVQLLVIGTGAPGSTVDMRGMIIKDFSGSMASDGGGKFIFADSAIWSAVPAGTLVTLSAGATQAEDIDPSDFYMAVNLGNATYFTNGGGSFDIATTDMLLLKSAGSGVSGVAGGIHALAGGTAGAQFTAYTGAKLRTTGTSGTDLGVIALNSTSQLSDYGASGQSESTDAQGGQTAASLNFASWNSPGNESYVKLLRGITDGTGTASIVNGAGESDFFGQNIFAKNLSNQTVAISYLPASTQTAITALSITVPSEMGTPSAPNVSVSGAGAGSASVAVTNQVVTISGLNALNPDPVDITVVIIPIANARNADPATFVPTQLGQTVAVEGVANVGKLGTGQINSALQDGSYGIGTYSASVANLPIRGNRYVVSGAVQQSSGYVRINITNAGAIYDFGATNDPAPLTVTVPQLNAATGATNGINLQSRVIRLENLSLVSGTWSNNSTVTLRDSASNNVAVRIQANSTAISPPSYPVTLTGIAGQFDSASPFDTGFQIQPRDQADAPVLPPVITSALTATATNGVAFVYQITTDNNPPATAFAAAPLPTGLSVDTSTGAISGTPTATGTFNVTISATNGGGTTTATLVLTVASLTPPAPSGLSYTPSSVSGVVGTAISSMSPTVTGTVDSYSIDPALPAGLSINPATGVISGTPAAVAAAGSYTITASNAGGTTTASVTISVISAYQAGYNSWAAANQLDPALTTGPSAGAPTADPDNDGFLNNSEYAFGTDPRVPNGSLLTTTTLAGTLKVTWNGPAAGLNYSVTATTNLSGLPFTVPTPVIPIDASVAGKMSFTNQAAGLKFFRVVADPDSPN